MPKYKIYIKKDVEQNDVFFSHYAQKQGVIATQLGPYGSGKIYIGKVNEGNYDPIGSSSVNRMKTLYVDLHMPKANNPIDVINIKQKLPAGVQGSYSNVPSDIFSYISGNSLGIDKGYTRYGAFVNNN